MPNKRIKNLSWSLLLLFSIFLQGCQAFNPVKSPVANSQDEDINQRLIEMYVFPEADEAESQGYFLEFDVDGSDKGQTSLKFK